MRYLIQAGYSGLGLGKCLRFQRLLTKSQLHHKSEVHVHPILHKGIKRSKTPRLGKLAFV